MPVMGTRLKRVVEMRDWRLSYAEIAAIVGHEIAAELSGLGSDIVWSSLSLGPRDVPREAKEEIMFSLLAARRWKMWYEGDVTVFDFDSARNIFPAAVYDYRVKVVPDGGTATLSIDSHSCSPHCLHAEITLDEDYFDFLGTLRYEGADEEWSEVED